MCLLLNVHTNCKIKTFSDTLMNMYWGVKIVGFTLVSLNCKWHFQFPEMDSRVLHTYKYVEHVAQWIGCWAQDQKFWG